MPFSTRAGVLLAVVALVVAAVPTLSALGAELRGDERPEVPGHPSAGRPVAAAGPRIQAAPDPAREAPQPDAPALGDRVADEPAAVVVGEASWYGPGFAGRRTASGEIYDPSELVAAHKELPFGTRVRVTNRRNGRSVVVRITDRGPYAGGRIIDLSAAAADVIGMRSSGTAPVALEIL